MLFRSLINKKGIDPHSVVPLVNSVHLDYNQVFRIGLMLFFLIFQTHPWAYAIDLQVVSSLLEIPMAVFRVQSNNLRLRVLK